MVRQSARDAGRERKRHAARAACKLRPRLECTLHDRAPAVDTGFVRVGYRSLFLVGWFSAARVLRRPRTAQPAAGWRSLCHERDRPLRAWRTNPWRLRTHWRASSLESASHHATQAAGAADDSSGGRAPRRGRRERRQGGDRSPGAGRWQPSGLAERLCAWRRLLCHRSTLRFTVDSAVDRPSTPTARPAWG